jgi:hypothetical protein
MDGLRPNDIRALPFFHESYVQLVDMYSIGRVTTLLIKNIGSDVFGEQLFKTIFPSIFAIIIS